MKIKEAVKANTPSTEGEDIGEKVQEDLQNQEEVINTEIINSEIRGEEGISVTSFEGKIINKSDDEKLPQKEKKEPSLYTTKELEKTVKDIAGAFYGSFISSIPPKYRQSSRETAVKEIIEFAKVLLTQLKKEL